MNNLYKALMTLIKFAKKVLPVLDQTVDKAADPINRVMMNVAAVGDAKKKAMKDIQEVRDKLKEEYEAAKAEAEKSDEFVEHFLGKFLQR